MATGYHSKFPRVLLTDFRPKEGYRVDCQIASSTPNNEAVATAVAIPEPVLHCSHYLGQLITV